MGSRSQHQAKAERNQTFIDTISKLEFPDWTATAIFYKAVHIIETVLADDGVHSESHEDRHKYLLNNYPEMVRPYRPLFNCSILARYRFHPIKKDRDIPELMKQLANLERLVSTELNARSSAASAKPS